MQLAHISMAWYAATIATIVFVVLFPLVLGFVLHRRLRAGWRYLTFDFSTIAFAQVLPAIRVSNATLVALAAEGVVTIGALLALWLIFALREGSSAPAADGSAPAASSLAQESE